MTGLLPAAAVAAAVWAVTYLATVDWRHTWPRGRRGRTRTSHARLGPPREGSRMTTRSKYDTDPDALAWARTKIQHEIDRAEKFVTQATTAGKTDSAQRWRHIANHLRNTFLGGDGCTIAVFDERRPAFTKAIDGAIPPAIDRAVRRDHSLCGAEPCSDCR